MCKYCAEHGEGKKWYLNLKNYAKELVENYPERKKLLDDYHKNYEKEIATSVEYKNLLLGVRSLDPEKAAISREKLREMWRAYRAQVVPLEDVKQILNIASPIAKLACICRRMYRASFDEKLCIGLGVYLDYVKEWPDFHRGFELLSKEEAIEFVEKGYRRGYVFSVWALGYPFICTLCQCEYPTCIGIKHRRQYGLDFTFTKSHYVARIDLNKCTGCRRCIERCPFGAITWSPYLNRPVIDVTRCFGCGVCRVVCETEAIELIDRETIPIVRELW